MADNIQLNEGTSGKYVATDEVSSGVHVGKTKLIDGTLDSTTVIAAGGGGEAAALRVTIANDSTGVVSVDDGGGALTVDGTVTANLSATDNQVLDDISADTGNIDTKLGTIDADTGAMVTDLAAIEVDLAAIEVDVAALEVLATAIDADTGAMVTDLAAIEVDLAALEVLTTAIDADTSAIATDAAAIEVLLGTIDADTGAMVTDLAAIEVDLAAIEVDVAALEVLATSIDADTNDIKTAVQLIDDAISGTEMQVDVVAALPAGTNNIGDVDVLSFASGKTIKRAVISAASSGDNTIVAAVADKKIKVLSICLVATAEVTVRFESGASGTALTGVISLDAKSGFILPAPADPSCHWIETGVNTLLNLELGGAVQVSGMLTYYEEA